jgi:AcrR family transcriptional regulator
VDKNIEDKRCAVVEAAYRAFSTRGFAHAQVTAIAEDSHVSTATIYKLFSSKEALFLAAYNHGLDILAAHVHAGWEVGDPLEGLKVIARSYASMCNSPLARRIVRLQIAQHCEPNAAVRADGFRLRALVETWFRPVLDRCVEAGLFQSGALPRVHALIIGYIAHQTLTYGLIINENKTAKMSGDDLADEAVRVALLAYG